MRAYETIRRTFWKPQEMAIQAFNKATSNEVVRFEPDMTVGDVKPMRIIITCGCGKSRCLNCIALLQRRSCGLFMSIPLIYQFLNKEVFGGFLYKEPDGDLNPHWIDKDRDVLVICSKKVESVGELTKEQEDALFRQRITVNGNTLKFTVTTDETVIYSFLKSVIINKKRCIVLSTYHSAPRLRNATNRLIKTLGDNCLFDLTFYDEAHTIFNASGSRDYLYKTADDDNGDEIVLDEEMVPNDPSVVDEVRCGYWTNLRYWGHRLFVTATQSQRMLNQVGHLGDELINYSFGDAVKDGIVRDYDLYVHLYRDEKREESKLEARLRIMARAMRDCDRRRVLCFHTFTNESEKDGTSAIKAGQFTKLIAGELGVSVDKVWTCAVSGEMSESERVKIFNDFQSPIDDGVYRVLFNCRVVGTGIDLKCIDMISFIDPRKNPVVITQNVFRGTRLNKHDNRRSVVFLPVLIEGDTIDKATKEERNVLIQKQLHQSCFKHLAKFLHCLKQHDNRWEQVFSHIDPSEADRDDTRDENLEPSTENFKVIIDSSITWDISAEDLTDMTISTVKLIGISDRWKSLSLDDRAQLVSDCIMEKHPDEAPKYDDDAYINGQKVHIGRIYTRAKKENNSESFVGLVGKKLIADGYVPWFALSHLERAEIARKYMITNHPNNAPDPDDPTIIPGHGGEVGSTYAKALAAKRAGKSRGKHGTLAKLFDDYGNYHVWNNDLNNPNKKADKTIGEEADALLVFKYFQEHFSGNKTPGQNDKTSITGKWTVGSAYGSARRAKEANRETGFGGFLSRLLDNSGLNFWKWFLLTDDEKALIIFNYTLENCRDKAPLRGDKIFVEECGLYLGNTYHAAKMAKKQNNPKGVSGKLAALLDGSDYKLWDKRSPESRKLQKSQVLVDFVMKKYPTIPPRKTDETIVEGYYVTGERGMVGILYQNAKIAMLENDMTGQSGENAKAFQKSRYFDWVNTFSNGPISSFKASNAKLISDFLKTKYRDKAPKSRDTTRIEGYGKEIGNMYLRIVKAKKDGVTGGLMGEVLKLLPQNPPYKPIEKVCGPLRSNTDVSKTKRQLSDEVVDVQESPLKKAVVQVECETDTFTADVDVDVVEDFCEDEAEPPMKKANNNCVHLWKETSTDDTYRYVVCELCERESKQKRRAAEPGYNEPNPDKKASINEWLSNQKYIDGCAWILDSYGMKTARALVYGKGFRSDEIYIPEYDQKVYEVNRKDKEFGGSLRSGDFLENLKRSDRQDFSLIYADFTGHYDTFVKPLFEHLEKTTLRPGTLVGVTWSNNGAGDHKKRGAILIDIGGFMAHNGFETIDAVTDYGYGDNGNMNVHFMIKK